MDVKPFRIERYYARYEFTTRYMLSSSDCESRTIAELLELEPDAHARLLGTWCGYTESSGASYRAFSTVTPRRSSGLHRRAGRSDFRASAALAMSMRSASGSPGAGVLLLPGSVYDEPDHVRVGFGRANLPDALGALESALVLAA